MDDNTMVESTAPQEEPTANAETDTEQVTIEPAEAEAEAQEPNANPEPDNAPEMIRIRYNHEDKDITKEDAVKWAQKGMASESVMTKLRYLSASTGKSINETVENILSAHEKMEREKLMEDTGGNEALVDELIRSRREATERSVKDQIEAELADEQKYAEDEIAKRAEEYNELRTMRPELDTFDKVPDSVLKLAKEKKISIVDAYLRHEDSERRKAETAKKQAEKAEASAVGKLDDTDDGGGESALISSLMKGIWGN